MKKILFGISITAFLLVIEGKIVIAADPLSFTVTNLGIKQLGIKNQNFSYPPEITPLTWKQPNGQRLYVLSTSWSWLCTSPDNILTSSPTSPLTLSPQNCQLITLPDVYDYIDANSATTHFKDPADINPYSQMTKDWKRTYDGILGLIQVNNKLIAIRHNENVNHMYPPDWTNNGNTFVYKNTVQNTVPDNKSYTDTSSKFWPNGCYSGYDNGVYQQCWDSYQNFISLLQIDYPSGGWVAHPSIVRPESDTTIHDQGPIIWPNINYRGVYDGLGHMTTWRSSGFYQPTLFVNNGYIYTFFKTTKYGGYCTGAARAPISSNGNAGSWYFFNRSRNAFDVPTLPTGFTKETIRNYYDTKTGYKSDCIVDENDNYASQPQYFNVARIRGTNYFIAAEERSITTTGVWKMGARISQDLVNWSPLQILSSVPCGSGSSGWGCGQFSYPTLLDKDATTNYEIDPDEFYILGNHATNTAGYELNSMKLSILVPTPTPTPTPIPGDLTETGDVTGDHVNIYDYNLLVSKFGNPYTIFDYNDLVGNFGK